MLFVTKRLCRSQKNILTLFVMAIICYAIFYYTLDKGNDILEDLSDTNRLVQKRLRENIKLEKGTGCKMPILDPFSKEILNLTGYVPNITCEGFDWVECNKSKCYVVKKILETMKDIACTYRDIVYVNDLYYYIGNPIRVIGDRKYILKRSDHVKVSCVGKDINSSFLSILPSRWHGYKAGFRPVPVLPLHPERRNSYNVMILCFDSTSHNGFIRAMKKTYKYLTENLNAVILNSYNIVGDGTSGSLYPILTGKGEEEYVDSQKQAGKNLPVDHTDFIFHLLKPYGYRTAYFEDMPWIGTFQYRFNGFRHQPADHYLRSLMMEETMKGVKSVNTEFPARHCIGAIPYYQLMLNLADEFLQLDGKKFCFTFISDICHDFNLLANADEAVLKFLQTLVSRQVLEDTLVILMGDHGSRFHGIRNTYQGKLEERLPLMAMLLPEKLKRIDPEALTTLKSNRDVLTTPFDIHATVLDILDLKHEINTYRIPGTDLSRAISLLEPIPKSRSCSEAGVMPHWCACIKWYNVSRKNPMFVQVARVLTEYINSIVLEPSLNEKCAKRTLIATEWVMRQSASDNLLKYSHDGIPEIDRYLGNMKSDPPVAQDVYYQVKIVMSPGRSIFEGTLMHNVYGDYYMVSERDISRTNAFGDESSCIVETHPRLIKYCYCTDKLRNITYSRDYFF